MLMSIKPVLCAGICLCLVAQPLVAERVPAQNNLSPDSRDRGSEAVNVPSLQRFVRRIWSESPALQEARAMLEAAQARLEAADKPLHNPVLELEAERTDVETTSVGVNQTIDWGNKREARRAVAVQELRLAEAEFMRKRQALTGEILEALVHYTLAREKRALNLRRSELMRSFADTVERRRAAGDLPAADAMLARVAYSEALITLASSESELAAAEAVLRGLVGFAPQVAWPPLPPEPEAPPEKVGEELLASLPELVASRARTAIARARIDLAERQRKGDPTLGIRAGWEEKEQLLGLTLEWPLFVRNRFTAEVRVAAREAAAEEASYREAHRRAKARLEGALARFRNTRHAWEVWKRTGEQALHEQMRLLERKWQAEELSATEFLIQARQNIDARTTATELKREVWLSAIAWLSASGRIEEWLGLADVGINVGGTTP